MAYILMPKRRRVPLQRIKQMTRNNFVVDPPSDDAMMMAVLRREARRRQTYGDCSQCSGDHCGT